MKYIYAEIVSEIYECSCCESYETDFHIWPNDMTSTYKQGATELLFI